MSFFSEETNVGLVKADVIAPHRKLGHVNGYIAHAHGVQRIVDEFDSGLTDSEML